MAFRHLIPLISFFMMTLTLGDKAIQVCPEGFDFFEGFGCYHFTNEASGLTWDEARQHCLDMDGFMMEVRNEHAQGFLFQELNVGSPDYWVGLSDASSEGSFLWNHSSQSASFSPWGVTEPNGGTAENCVAVTAYHSFFWSDEVCSNTLQTICQTPALINICPGAMWTYEPTVNRCYMFEEPQSMTWQQARDYCRGLGDGIYLAEMTSEAENEAVKAMLSSNTNNGFLWIGLNDLDEHGRYVWEYSGNETQFFDWGSNQPEGGDKNCILMFDRGAYQWYDSLCGSTWWPLCEAAPATKGQGKARP